MKNGTKRKEEERETKQITDWDEMYPGRFLKAGDFKGKIVTLKIAHVYAEKLPEKDGTKRFKGVLGFEKTDLEFTLNKTNGLCVRAMFGREVQAWVGKRVSLFPIQYEGDLAIRVWGSPDIEKEFDLTIELPRKKAFNMMMHRVVLGKAPQKAPTPPPPAEPELAMDSETGEVQFDDEEAATILAAEEAA